MTLNGVMAVTLRYFTEFGKQSKLIHFP